MQRLVFTFLALAVLVVVAPIAIDAGLQSSGDPTSFNESFSPTAETNYTANDSTVTLNHSHRDGVRYSDEVRVVDADGTVAAPGADYTWHTANGTLTIPTDSRLADDDTATVTYAVIVPTDTASALADGYGSLLMIAGAFLLVFVVAILAALLRWTVGA